ncbi:MAG: hypothetical protein LBP22_04425 [Deltaproteobacteria bacterium]|nr:hypothetical protein [Deltaproteobacteria bacterium]
MKYIYTMIALLAALGLCLVPAGGVGLAQESNSQSSPSVPPADSPGSAERESLHLNTIGTYSAGFVLQSFGYIGVLADVLSQGVYEPEMVSSMLGETITFLKNANQQLTLYQDKNLQISQADQKFIIGISEIIRDLTAEAEALSSFAQSRKQEDLERFEAARKQAWAGIKKTLGVN